MTKPLLQPRQLRFRVWDRDRMVLVHTLSFNDGGMMWHGPSNKMGWGWLDETCTSWNDTHNPKPSEHDVSPVMQWTGLKDKNGVLIYEGDILRANIPVGFSGESYQDVFAYVRSTRLGGFEASRGIYGVNFDNGASHFWRCEVVGDVYSSPELLLKP